MHDGPSWSASQRYDRGDDFAGALARYRDARDVAIADKGHSDALLEAWGGAVDRVIATRTTTPLDLAAKVRTMLMEGRGGDACLIAILADLDGMAGGVAPDGGAAAIGRAGKAVGQA